MGMPIITASTTTREQAITDLIQSVALEETALSHILNADYGVGAGNSPLPPANTDPSFVVGGNINVTAGSNASSNTIIDPDGTVISYTMGNPNGIFTTGRPVDFAEAERYLKCASNFWGSLESNGTGEVVYNQLNLTGYDETLNIFSLNSSNLYGTGISLAQLNGINIIAPLSATILINAAARLFSMAVTKYSATVRRRPEKTHICPCLKADATGLLERKPDDASKVRLSYNST